MSYLPNHALLHLDLQGAPLEIEVQVFRESRNSLRAAVGTKGLILRIPRYLNEKQEQEAWLWLQNWAKKICRDEPAVLQRFLPRSYADGSSIQVGKRTYGIKISVFNGVTHSARLLSDKTIHFKLANNPPLSPAIQSDAIKNLLSRIVAADYYPEMAARIAHLNAIHFRQSFRQLKLKYLRSKWGSCSGNTIINLSTRLLFAPEEVQDYVMIHELAHLKEMNHSQKFWDLVAGAMPDFEEKENWLTQHGHSCDF